MTDQEIRWAILKYAYNEKKAGKVAMAVLDRIVGDYNLDNKRVLSILRSLENKGLLKSATSGKWVSASDKEITEEGMREYREKCSESKGC